MTSGSWQQDPKLKSWNSVSESAAYLEVSRQRIWQMVKAGNLPAKQVGRQIEIHGANLFRMKIIRAELAKLKNNSLLRRRRPRRDRGQDSPE